MIMLRATAAVDHLSVAARAIAWKPYSRLFLVGDNAAWSLSEDVRALRRLARQLDIRIASDRRPLLVARQAVFHASQFALIERGTFEGKHRVGLAYFHGVPRAEEPVFCAVYDALKRQHHRLRRVQVSHSAMHSLVLESGIASDKVHHIPIGIDIEAFPVRTEGMRRSARAALGVPDTAVVVGSFQKDGVGWGEGFEPKLVKGPDILLDVVARLREHVPELFVLLSGPARGFVKRGLEQLGVPYTHAYVAEYRQMGALYQALDLYLVTSREEGGPKAVLESMASGVPLVSTRVGQAADLIRHGCNGWLVDVGDVDALVACSRLALGTRAGVESVLTAARATAEANTYDAQLALWRAFFDGFVDRE